MQRTPAGHTVKPVLTGNMTKLRPKILEDAVNDYLWRKDPELAELDATTIITCSYEDYYRIYLDEFQRTAIPGRFGIETLEMKYIGNCGFFCVDEKKKQAEVGIMIGDKDYWSKGFGTDAMSTLLKYLFSELSLKRVYLKTLYWNIRAQKSFSKCGFSIYDHNCFNGYDFTFMECIQEENPIKNRK